MEHVRTVLAAVGALFVGAGVGMVVEHYGVSHDVAWHITLTIFFLIVIWVL